VQGERRRRPQPLVDQQGPRSRVGSTRSQAPVDDQDAVDHLLDHQPVELRLLAREFQAAARCQFLAGQPDMESVEEAGTGREALDLVRNDACDVMLLDISMPGQNGVDVLRAIRLRKPELPVLMLSSFPEQHYALQMLKLGASGYLPKDCEPTDLLRAIRSVAQGRRFVSEAVGDLLANGLGAHGDELPHTQLSDRELQVFLRLAKGESVTAIANVLNLSFKTISTYRSRVLEKLSLRSNSDVTYYAMKNGLIQ
jgi:DNA-binding NarL/FixJ family response regulator